MAGFECRGVWWLPGNPEAQVTGILKFDPETGSVLELMGMFVNSDTLQTMSARLSGTHILVDEDEPIILGQRVGNGEAITLHRCYLNQVVAGAGPATASYKVIFIFIGVHFPDRDSITFRSIQAEFSHLSEWFEAPRATVEPSKDTGAEGVIIRYAGAPPVRVPIDADNTLVEFFPSARVSNSLGTDLTIRTNVPCKVISQVERPFDYFYKTVWLLRTFIWLAVGRQIDTFEWYGTTDLSMVMVGSEEHYRPVEILFQPHPRPLPAEYVHRSAMLFTRETIGSRLNEFLRNWFDKADTLEQVYELYFGTLQQPGLKQHHLFSLFVQGLEVYHRRTMIGLEKSEEEHDVRLIYVLYHVPKIAHGWVKRLLRHSNEINLEKRILQIINRHSQAAAVFIKDSKSFATRVMHVRNYYTHYDPKSPGKDCDWTEMFKIIQQLNLLLRICLLAEIGFRPDEIQDIVLTKGSFQNG